MPAPDEILVNLNARIPRDLMRRVKLHTTKKGILLRPFITEAIVEALRAARKKAPRALVLALALGLAACGGQCVCGDDGRVVECKSCGATAARECIALCREAFGATP
jgi:hypothetical protein